MNKRLTELVQQAKIQMVSEPRLEQFADLIINDIYAILDESQTYNACTWTTFDLSTAQCVAEQIKIGIKQHFKDNE